MIWSDSEPELDARTPRMATLRMACLQQPASGSASVRNGPKNYLYLSLRLGRKRGTVEEAVELQPGHAEPFWTRSTDAG